MESGKFILCKAADRKTSVGLLSGKMFKSGGQLKMENKSQGAVWKLLMCGINMMKLLKPVNFESGGIAETPGSVGG